MSDRYRLLPEIMILPSGAADRWVVYNPLVKSALGVDLHGVALLGTFQGSDGDAGEKGGHDVTIWQISKFCLSEGLLEDPSGFVRKPEVWGDETILSTSDAIEAFAAAWMLVRDEADYESRFSRRQSLLDRNRFGNMHDQLGFHLRLEKRTDPDAWWLGQKFAGDDFHIRPDNLYGVVQKPAMEQYFAAQIAPGMKALDIGCGIGTFSAMMAKAGANVHAVDPNPEFLAIAQKTAPSSIAFEERRLGVADALNGLPDQSFDLVFMSDALLFYFVPVVVDAAPDIGALIDDIKRVLKPGGRFVSLEPHATFYHSPWLGSTRRPTTVVTEYRSKRTRIAATLGEILPAFTRAGLALQDYQDLYAGTENVAADPLGCGFASEFPIWHLLEFVNRPTDG